MPTINERPDVPQVMNDEIEHRRRLAQRANASLPHDATKAMTAPLRLKSYTVATVPTASLYTGALIHVSDETGGAITAFSDGTDWRRCTDRAVVS